MPGSGARALVIVQLLLYVTVEGAQDAQGAHGARPVCLAAGALIVLTLIQIGFGTQVRGAVDAALDAGVARDLALGTVGVRLPIDRFVCKVKMSQDKDEQSRRQVLAALKGDGPYASPALAADMQRTLEEGADATDRTVPTTQSLDPPAERN